MELFRLDGRIALVSGGAGTYGKHISTALAEAGAHVIVASRDLAHCQEFVNRELEGKGWQGTAAALDLAEESSIRELGRRIQGEFGRLDVLYNNAVLRRADSFTRQTAADWEASMRVNGTGLFLACQVFGEIMVQQQSGSIVNISSIYGMVGPDFGIYEGTTMVNPADYTFVKGGMIALTRYLATHFAPHGIRVNCLSPGGFGSGQRNQFVDKYHRRTPMGRMAGPNDIKGVAVFFASDASAYITGQTLPVDGGWTAW
ncbi:MAG: SDR family oxidoreductase [Chloroflexi bacterium]|nr:SDR family oxidoreductase [Chloroflexota bacterium]